jgi:hypothetical protein
MLNVYGLSLVYAECFYAECHNSKCNCPKRHYSEVSFMCFYALCLILSVLC